MNRNPNRKKNKELGEWGTRYIKDRLRDLGVCLETHDIANHDFCIEGIEIEVKVATLRVGGNGSLRWDFNFRNNRADFGICFCKNDQEIEKSVLVKGRPLPSFISVYKNSDGSPRIDRKFKYKVFKGDKAIDTLRKEIVNAKT